MLYVQLVRILISLFKNNSKDCMTEKLELERRLAIALGLLASCQLELTGCGRQAANDNDWWGRMVLASAIR